MTYEHRLVRTREEHASTLVKSFVNSEKDMENPPTGLLQYISDELAEAEQRGYQKRISEERMLDSTPRHEDGWVKINVPLNIERYGPLTNLQEPKPNFEAQKPIGYIKKNGLKYINSMTPLVHQETIINSTNQSEFIPVYTHPTKVAVLEERIAELEAENEKLKQPQYFNCADAGEYFGHDLNDLSCGMDLADLDVAEAMGSRTVQNLWFFHDGINCHSFDSEEEATKAADAARARRDNSGGENS